MWNAMDRLADILQMHVEAVGVQKGDGVDGESSDDDEQQKKTAKGPCDHRPIKTLTDPSDSSSSDSSSSDDESDN
jgi:hypothetical protein